MYLYTVRWRNVTAPAQRKQSSVRSLVSLIYFYSHLYTEINDGKYCQKCLGLVLKLLQINKHLKLSLNFYILSFKQFQNKKLCIFRIL